jgi:hypothetical protein
MALRRSGSWSVSVAMAPSRATRTRGEGKEVSPRR